MYRLKPDHEVVSTQAPPRQVPRAMVAEVDAERGRDGCGLRQRRCATELEQAPGADLDWKPRRATSKERFGQWAARPDNRSGWLDGATPDVVEEFLDTREEAENAGIEIRLWDPQEQLRFAKTESVPPRPDGAPNRWPREAAA